MGRLRRYAGGYAKRSRVGSLGGRKAGGLGRGLCVVGWSVGGAWGPRGRCRAGDLGCKGYGYTPLLLTTQPAEL